MDVLFKDVFFFFFIRSMAVFNELDPFQIQTLRPAPYCLFYSVQRHEKIKLRKEGSPLRGLRYECDMNQV